MVDETPSQCEGKDTPCIPRACAHHNWAGHVGAEPGFCSSLKRGSSRANGRATRGRVSQLHQLGRSRDSSRRSRWCSLGCGGFLADRTWLRSLAIRGRSSVGDLRCHSAHRVLGHERNRWGDITKHNQLASLTRRQPADSIKEGDGCLQNSTAIEPSRLRRMPTPQLLNDIISLLLLLAPSAALVSLVLAGVTLRREGGTVFAIGGGFTKWMFWAVVFLTLQPLLTWFSSFGIRMPLPGGGI